MGRLKANADGRPLKYKTFRMLVSFADNSPIDVGTLVSLQRLLGTLPLPADDLTYAAFEINLPPADFASAVAVIVFDYDLHITTAD